MRFLKATLIGVVVVIAVGFVAAFAFRSFRDWQDRRDLAEAALAPRGPLPENVRPLHYQLALRVDPDLDDFSGRVEIDVEFDEQTLEFFLHGERIDPELVEIGLPDGRILDLNYREMGHSGVVRLRAEEAIPAGRAQIRIEYTAAFDTTLEALYLVESGGQRYAFTQFEPIDARQVFPSFDEPRFKVPFDLSLDVRTDHEGITNTPERNRRDLGDGFRRIEFEETPPLPTYLLAFAVGPLDVVEAEPIPASALRPRPIPLRGIGVAGKGKEFTFALENTANLVLALEAYFGIPYPYRKLDIAAVPDFGFGAMENAGLIVYREQRLLLGEHPAVGDLRGFASMHAHELAHQWFGNLVTMKWWDDIWLNESFATWMGNRIANEVHPGLEFDRETVREGHQVMEIDVYTDTRRVREVVEDREEIVNSFDWISYAKGGAFLQMMESWIGPEVFREGIQIYLERHAGGNATIDDFLAPLEETSGRPVRRVAQGFLEQRGVPLISLDWKCEGHQVSFEIEQSRYVEVGSSIDREQHWVQPLCVRLMGEDFDGTDRERLCVVIEEGHSSPRLEAPECPEAILPNASGEGYTRWTLSESSWEALLARIDSLDPAEKYSVASNLSADFRAGRLSASRYVAMIAPIVAQSEWDVATQPIDTLSFISDYIASETERLALSRYVSSLYAVHLEPPEQSLESTGASDAGRRLLVSRVLSLLALTLRDPEQQGRMADLGIAATGYGGDGVLDLSVVEGDLLSVALASAVEREGEPFFDALRVQIEQSEDGGFREKALWAIGLTRDPDLASEVRSLGFLLSLRLNELPMVISAQSTLVEHRRVVFDFVRRFFPFAQGFMPERYLSSAPFVASNFCDRTSRDEVEAFFAPYADEISGLSRSLSQALERIELCESLVSRQSGLAVPSGFP